ncbi:lipoprotein [Longimycelium tulufanense]|uniref:Lipoprotein n=1 Tax=Longimycelium tulufanense TaxID=907463 RepID=A0A8J3CGW8_9PSEU|nr:C40 family peptidase [Longimycelium tulufanense]GGM64507.1 lipoprotein [Longimycelium tulufanense]
MRIALLSVVMVAVLATVVTTTTGVVRSVIGGGGDENTTYGICDAMIGAWPEGGLPRAEQEVRRLGDESKRIAALIITIGKQRDLPPRAWQIALQAARQESGIRNLTYGDRDSLGIFQIRGMHGSLRERLDVTWQINWFYDTLVRIRGWERMRPGDAAQAVERSAFPDRYHRWEPMAVQLVADIGNVEDPTGCYAAPPPSESASRAVSFVFGELGDAYEWGATGPDRWDCSALVQAAYRAGGVQIPRVTYDQWKAGAYIPIEQVQPGDLVFYGNMNDVRTIHHVGLYIGNGEMIEAPYTGANVRKSKITVWPDLIPYAVRPGV